MQVFYKSTDFLEDQVLVSGFAAGGLSEVPQENFRTCSLASMLTQELGTFGLRPEVSTLSGSAFQGLCWTLCLPLRCLLKSVTMTLLNELLWIDVLRHLICLQAMR